MISSFVEIDKFGQQIRIMETDWQKELVEKMWYEEWPAEICNVLKTAKANGVTQGSARDFLDDLRKKAIEAADEAKEDRILEVLDIVEGFCNVRYRVW